MSAAATIERLATLDTMKTVNRWLIASPAKIPHYVDGQRRNGDLDSEADHARLASYGAARAALEHRPGWFLGFALGPEGPGYWQGIDLDKIEEKELADLAEALPGYVETSPSGKGLHAIGYGRKFATLGSNQTGIEAYAAGRFFTVTENAVRDETPRCLAHHVETVLAPRHRKTRGAPSRPTRTSHDDDDRVLGYLYTRPNNLAREDWVRLCLALKHHFGDRARDGWIAFSSRYAGGVTPGEAERQWETAKPRGDVDIGTAVHLLGGHERRQSSFQASEAWRETFDPKTGEITRGPAHPDAERDYRGTAKGGADEGEQFVHPYARFQDTEPTEFRATEFVIDGAIVAGAVMLAGGWGAGKTTQLVPLLFRAAHLCQPDDPLKPLLRRRVIYVTEDVDQVRQIIRSMRVAGELDGIPAAEVADYFKIVSAARLKAEDIVLAAKVYEGLETINRSPDTGREYAAQAVVVFDTRSAAIALDDENDNTEAAQVIATLRQGMPANPTIIVGHIAKALKKADVADLSGRGGGAWEADAQQVLYLVNDDGERWLDVATPKHRFVSAIDGIRFTSCANETSATDPLGNTVTVRLMHGKPEAVDLGGRAIEKQRKKEEEAQAAANALRMKIMQQARKWRTEGQGFNRQRVKEGIAGRGAQLTEIIADLIAEDWLLELPIPKEQRRNNKQAHYLAVLSPDERDEYRETGAIPAFALIPPKSMVKS